MLLGIDIGNTDLMLGVFDPVEITHHWRLATDTNRTADEYGILMLDLLKLNHIPVEKVTGVCIASVVPPVSSKVEQACQEYLRKEPLLISHQLKLGIQIAYADPSAVGVDRICDAVAAYKLYGGPACIIDFGTATTFNALTEDGVYLGGAITAGIGLAAEALFQRTSKLTRVDIHVPPSVIGQNTTHAMQSGLVFGYVAMVEGMISRFQKELGSEMKVIGTGGLVETISSQTSAISIVNPWLTIEGVRLIWEMNQ